MHETRISNFMRSNGPSTKIPAEDLRFPSSKKRQKRWNRTFYVLNIRSVDHEHKHIEVATIHSIALEKKQAGLLP